MLPEEGRLAAKRFQVEDDPLLRFLRHQRRQDAPRHLSEVLFELIEELAGAPERGDEVWIDAPPDARDHLVPEKVSRMFGARVRRVLPVSQPPFCGIFENLS